MPDQSEAPIVRKLLRREDGWPQTGSGWINSAGEGEIKMNPVPQVLVNPDGPEAAEIIRLCEEALEEAERCIDDAEREFDCKWSGLKKVIAARARIKGQNP